MKLRKKLGALAADAGTLTAISALMSFADSIGELRDLMAS
jgi:hypothetical protein